ncbi:unnamed protein product [Orchesella dallaii]|uniref:Uncharacterized protein n=1 Tax=Orchesella dallaii TaxID=48710 RepID=A0ABP1QR62_9HEXA
MWDEMSKMDKKIDTLIYSYDMISSEITIFGLFHGHGMEGLLGMDVETAKQTLMGKTEKNSQLGFLGQKSKAKKMTSAVASVCPRD